MAGTGQSPLQIRSRIRGKHASTSSWSTLLENRMNVTWEVVDQQERAGKEKVLQGERIEKARQLRKSGRCWRRISSNFEVGSDMGG